LNKSQINFIFRGLFIWRNIPQWGRASSFTRFVDQTHDLPQSVVRLWTSDQLVAETSTSQHTTLQKNIYAPMEFELTISTGERTQTHILDRSATGICFEGLKYKYIYIYIYIYIFLN